MRVPLPSPAPRIPVPPPPKPYAIQARSLTKTFRAGDQTLTVLDRVDLDVEVGEFVTIMGPSGSGKTTFLNQVGLLDTPTAGRLRLAGRDTKDLSENDRADLRARTLGFVFQGFHLVSGLTALQNVMLPMSFQGVARRMRQRRAKHLLERVGLADRIHHRPRQLSGGQKQRVAIARALALEPPILLADEPTGNLDSVAKEEIMGIFRDIHRTGRTILHVTHDAAQARHGTRLVRFKDGRVVSERSREVAA